MSADEFATLQVRRLRGRKATAALNIRMQPELLAALDRASEAENVSKGHLCRACIVIGLRQLGLLPR
jgi:hypothetical protein